MPTERRRNIPKQKERDIKADFTSHNHDHPVICSHSYRSILFAVITSVALISIGYRYWNVKGQLNLHLRNDTCDRDAFEVADLPGKGKGIVATRDIEQGELIIREKPLFIVPPQIKSSPTTLISQLLHQTAPADRQAFLNLSYVNFPKNLKPEQHPDQVALAIFQTNAVAAGDGVGIFPRMARLNHGCSRAFNVVYSWRESEKTLVVYALKSIRRGEELLTTYTNTKRPRDQRRAFLAEHYGFLCACAVCSLPDKESHASDKRLQDISNLYERFATWGARKISGKDAIEIVKNIWEIEDKEGYWSERGRLAADAAWVAASHSDATATRLWAELAVEWYTYELGEASPLVSEIRQGVTSPEYHPAWGSREHLKVGGPDRGLCEYSLVTIAVCSMKF